MVTQRVVLGLEQTPVAVLGQMQPGKAVIIYKFSVGHTFTGNSGNFTEPDKLIPRGHFFFPPIVDHHPRTPIDSTASHLPDPHAPS